MPPLWDSSCVYILVYNNSRVAITFFYYKCTPTWSPYPLSIESLEMECKPRIINYFMIKCAYKYIVHNIGIRYLLLPTSVWVLFSPPIECCQETNCKNLTSQSMDGVAKGRPKFNPQPGRRLNLRYSAYNWYS